MSKVQSARALFEKRIELNLEQHGEVQSKDFISVLGKSNERPHSLLASPRRRAVQKAASASALPSAPMLSEPSPEEHANDPSIQAERPKSSKNHVCNESMAEAEKIGSHINREGPYGFSESISFSPWTDELKGTGSGSLVYLLQGGSEDDANVVHEDSRLVECLQAFDQSIRMANAKKIKSLNRRGSLVQEVLEELDESLVEATQQTVVQQSQRPGPEAAVAATGVTEDSVLTLKPSSIRNNRRFMNNGYKNTSGHGSFCHSPGGATAETCSTTSYETSGSIESLFQQRKANGSNRHRVLKSYGYNKQRGNSPASSVTSSVSKSSCGSARSRNSTSNPKSSPLVAPSPSTLERHSQVRHSVLQGVRPAPLTEQEDETPTHSLSAPKPVDQAMSQSSSSLPLLEVVDSIEEDHSPTIHLPSGVKTQPKDGGAEEETDEEWYKKYGADSCSSFASHAAAKAVQAPGHNSSSEVTFGFGPMSPHRVARPSFNLGFGACYTFQRDLETPTDSQGCPQELLEAQQSMLTLESEEDENDGVEFIASDKQGEAYEMEEAASPKLEEENVSINSAKSVELEQDVDGDVTFESTAIGASKPMDGAESAKPLGSERDGELRVNADLPEVDIEGRDNNSVPALDQAQTANSGDWNVAEAKVYDAKENATAENSISEDTTKYGYEDAPPKKSAENLVDNHFNRADASEEAVDYGYGDANPRSPQIWKEARTVLPPRTRQLRRSLSFDGEELRDKFDKTALPGRPKLRGRRASLSSDLSAFSSGRDGGAVKYGCSRMSITSQGDDRPVRLFRSQSRRMSTGTPFISQQMLAKPQMARSRVSALELTMKKTEIVARSMARRRGTLVHIATGKGFKKKKELPHRINDMIKFSLEDLWKRRRTPAQQKEIDMKADKIFPKKKHKVTRRVSIGAAPIQTNSGPSRERRGSLNSIEKHSKLRFDFVEANAALREKIFRVAATRIQARLRTYLHQSRYRIELLEKRWARIEYEKMQEMTRIAKKLKVRKKTHKKKTLKALTDLAEQASKARKLTDHLKSENNNIKDQNARLQQLCFKLRKINGHMEKTLKTHNKNFRSMWEFVEKMKTKKKRIEDKVKKYESRIEQHQKNIDIVQERLDAELKRKDGMINTIHSIANTISVKSSNERLKQLVNRMADGEPMDEKLLAEIVDAEDEVAEKEFDLNKSQHFDMLCETFHETFVSLDMEDDETVDEGFLLALSMDDNSTISDVSSIGSDIGDSGDETGFAYEEDDVYEELVVEDDDKDECVRSPGTSVVEEEGEIIEEIIEEVISDDGYIIEEVVVSSDDEEEAEDDFSCQSSVFIDHGSIIM